MKRRVYVLDSVAFIRGYPPQLIGEEHYIPLALAEELKDERSKTLLEASVRSGHVKIRQPTQYAIEKSKEAARETGDIRGLSEVDLHILALAVDLMAEGVESVIVTDDYSIQNVAHKMKILFKPMTQHGIKEAVKWKVYCSACRKVYPPTYLGVRCEVCGGELKRKKVKRRRIWWKRG
nr:ribonuclease VapC [Candidatus Bathyarchaeota archaeon]